MSHAHNEYYIRRIPPRNPLLNRNVVHDPASWAYPKNIAVDQSTWRTRTLRVWDPVPNPDQQYGNCTTCAKGSQLNAQGNRVRGVVLNMEWAITRYEEETLLDPFPGYFKRGDPNSQDTGSNGLASCKVAQKHGEGGRYEWFFGGADEIVTYLMHPDAIPVSNGTIWTEGMFRKINSRGTIEPTGQTAGGHQWVTIGYDERYDETENLCWWGTWRRFRLKRDHHNELLADDGDAHTQERTQP